MKNKIVAACLILLLAVSVLAMAPNRGSHRSAATLDTDSWIDANKILMFVTNKGSFAYDQGGFLGKNDGLYFPFTSLAEINSGANTNTVIFAAGIWLGGIDAATGDTIVTVAEYSDDFWPGPMENGTFIAGADVASEYRTYKLYSDSLANNPNFDYTNWPVDQGAPVDADGNPAMMGDQMMWAVYNDANPVSHTNDASTAEGLGVEVRQTTFAFAREGALANIVFVRFRIYNNGNRNIQDMFVSLWADPDLGNAGDDFVGSVVDLSLGYCYNDGEDSDYGSRAPAVGFDFFQGPLESTGNMADTAIMWDFTKFPGYVNLPMSSFNKYINGTDPQDFVWTYQYMNGLDASDFGGPVTDPATGDTTKFYGNGDPVTGTGFLDVVSADRRYMLSTGPFDFAPGDSTEVVAAIIVGQGASQLASITELIAVDDFAQKVYDAEFQLPSPPTKPEVTVTELDGQLILHWGTISEDEPGDYQFEGYALVQGASASGPWTDTLGWFDITNEIGAIADFRFDKVLGKDVEFAAKPGTNAGLEHHYSTVRDVTGGGSLINYTDYFFRLEAYSFDTLQPSGEKTLTSATTVTAMPHPALTGTDINSATGDTLVVTHTAIGGADLSPGSASVSIVDPAAVTGDGYKIVFTSFYVKITVDDLVDPPVTTYDTIQGSVWHVVNTTTGDTVVNNWANQSDVEGNNYPVADGLIFKVAGPALGVASFQCVANGAGALDPIEPGAADFQDFPTPPGLDGDGRPDDRQQLGDGHWFFHTGGDYGSIDDWIARTFRGDADRLTTLGGYDWEMRFTGENSNPGVAGSYAWAAFTSGNAFWVPFELWRIGVGTPNDPSDDVRLIPWIFDDGGDSLYYMSSWGADPNCGPGGCESPVSGGDNDPYTDWVYWKVPGDETPGEAGYQVFEAAMLSDPQNWAGDYEHAVMDRTVLVNWNGDTTATATGGATSPSGYNQDLPELGTVFRLVTFKPNAPTDVFSISSSGLQPTVAATGSEDLLDEIKTVPNPYYLFSDFDASLSNRNLKFINLPEECTISIYNLSGDLVRTVEKDDASTELMWDVENEFGIPVGSGIYIYVVDAPGFGTKIGKMAIFTETELLDQF